jgi:hypothetical protein
MAETPGKALAEKVGMSMKKDVMNIINELADDGR